MFAHKVSPHISPSHLTVEQLTVRRMTMSISKKLRSNDAAYRGALKLTINSVLGLEYSETARLGSGNSGDKGPWRSQVAGDASIRPSDVAINHLMTWR